MSRNGTTPNDLPLTGRLSFLLKDTFIYGIATTVSKSFAFITFPILARHFSVTDYGVLDYFIFLSNFLIVLFVFGQDSAVARYYYEHEDDWNRRQVISQSLGFQLAVLSLLLPIFWFLAEPLGQLLIDTESTILLFKITLLQVLPAVLINFCRNIFKWTFSRTKFLIMSLGFTAVHTLSLVIAILCFGVGIKGVLLTNLCVNILFGVLGLVFVREWLVVPVDFRWAVALLSFAIPYGLVGFITALSPLVERTIVSYLLEEASLGFYAAGAKVAMIVGLVVGAFQTAWGPFSLSLFKEPGAEHTFNLVLKLFTLVISLVVFLLTVLSPVLIEVLATDRYLDATLIVLPISLGLAIQAISSITEVGIVFAKRSSLYLYSYLLGFTVTIISFFIFTPELGLTGAGISVFIGYLTKSLISSWLAQKVHPIPWNYVQVLNFLCFASLLGVVGSWLIHRQASLFINIPFLVIGISSLLGAGCLVLLSAAERNLLLTWARGKF